MPVSDTVIDYAVSLVTKTRPLGSSEKMVKDFITWGAGPRASQYLILAAKTRCLLEGRFTPDIHDVKKFALPVLCHRLITNFNVEADGVKPDTIITKLITD